MITPSVKRDLDILVQMAQRIRREHPYQHHAEWHHVGEFLPAVIDAIVNAIERRQHAQHR